MQEEDDERPAFGIAPVEPVELALRAIVVVEAAAPKGEHAIAVPRGLATSID